MSSTAPAKIGKYEIRGTLGKGAMGTVYDGWDLGIGRRVAIKTVRLPSADDEEAIEGLARFKREAQAAGRLTHPNIVGVFDYGETDELAYIVMEFVAGRSLKDVLAANERLTTEQIIVLMEEVLAGLAYSHAQGVVHRDIKPANIMLTLDNHAKIADFGIARIEASSMTQAGTVMGTPAYMSPEQFMGQVVDRRTDIYSCGVMLYQMLTGDRPFDGSMSAIMHKALTTTPPRPSELAVTAPASLDPVVARAMARRPEDRFDNATDFAVALRARPAEEDPFAADETIVAPRRETPREEMPAPAKPVAGKAQPVVGKAKPPSKLPMIAGGGVALAFVAGVGIWAMLPSHPPVPPQAANVPAANVPAVNVPAAGTPVTSTPITATPARPSEPSRPPAAAPTPAPAAAPIPAPTPAPTPVPTQQATNVAPAPVEPQAAPAPSPFLATPPAPTAAPAAPSGVVPPAVVPPAVTPQTAVEAPPAPAPAPPRPAEVAASLAASLPTLPCFLGSATTAGDGAVTVSGVSGLGAPEAALLEAVAAARPSGVSWQTQGFDGPYCPALDLLRPVSEPAARGGLEFGQAGGIKSLLDNDVIALQVTMPSFAGFLHLAYLQHDSTVSPLVPGPGYPQQTYPAHAHVALGSPRKDFEGWRVGPPFGTDMIIAIASTAPLFTKALPDSESLSAYLAALQSAIDALRHRGGSVAASAILLDTRAAH